MLNELHKLSVTLVNNNVSQYVWHDEYKPLQSSAACYRIWLCGLGTVKKIELMDRELVARCRKFGNNQQAFPSFNIAPLYRTTSAKAKEYYDALIKGEAQLDMERLRSICIHDNWSANLLRKSTGCLHKRIPAVPEDSAIFYLMQITAQIDGAKMRASLENYIWKQLQNDIKTYLPILLHVGNAAKQPKNDAGSLSIMLDLVEWEQFGDPIASDKTTRKINEWLLSDASESDEQAEATFRDAFGVTGSDISKPMPSVRLAPGFEVALRAMFREQHCQHRYAKADDASFPIVQANRSAAKAALEWIARPENEKKTWRRIDGDSILFVYPDKLPEILPKFAGLFAGIDDSQASIVDESRFETVAKEFMMTLDAIGPKNRPQSIQIFALQQIPPALSKRAKVAFTRNLTVEALIMAAKGWQSGCSNVPDISLIELKMPFPLEVSKIANKVWKQNGEQADGKSSVLLMRYYQGMELLIDPPISSPLLRIVRGLIINSSGLILFAGNNLPRLGKEKAKEKTNWKDAHNVQLGSLLPLLGLLLSKCGIKKEDYIMDTAYLLGQVLKISDSLHALYCEIKREGDVPPQLVGNSVFIMASETPAKTLALLSTRMCPYIAWAKQYKVQNKPKSGLAAWHILQYEMVMSQLHSKLVDNVRFSDVEKAQLFIGYLATLPKISGDKQVEEKESVQSE